MAGVNWSDLEVSIGTSCLENMACWSFLLPVSINVNLNARNMIEKDY
jgi:hypothetical protein